MVTLSNIIYNRNFLPIILVSVIIIFVFLYIFKKSIFCTSCQICPTCPTCSTCPACQMCSPMSVLLPTPVSYNNFTGLLTNKNYSNPSKLIIYMMYINSSTNTLQVGSYTSAGGPPKVLYSNLPIGAASFGLNELGQLYVSDVNGNFLKFLTNPINVGPKTIGMLDNSGNFTIA